MEVSATYYKLVKFFEGLHDGNLSMIGLQPKPCPSGIYTTCWGHAIVDPKTGKFVTTATKNGYKRACELFTDLTIEQADKLLEEDTLKYQDLANSNLKVILSQFQFDALVSHTFNCGVSETLYKLINTLPLDDPKIKIWWTTKYITGQGKQLPGLIKRRRIEYELFSTGRLNLI